MLPKIISDDGAIQGWFVALIITICRITVYVLDYFIPSMVEVEVKIGAGFTTFALTSVGSWFAYKIVKPLTG